jgi:putative endonuclease
MYILTNATGALYIGVTSNLPVRVSQHKNGASGSFTSRYHVDRLVYAEAFDDASSAILREKEVKKWRRTKKLALILEANPNTAEIDVR